MGALATLDESLSRARNRRRLPSPAQRRALRESLGLTLADVAAAVRVSVVAVHRWESGARTPRGALLKSYFDVLERLRTEVLRDVG